MSRYHPRGRSPRWGVLPGFYPAVDLLRAYRAGTLDFPGLEAAYVEALEEAILRQPDLAQWIEESPRLGDITLLCYERWDQPCHRRALAHWLKRKQPELQLAVPLN